MLAKIILNLPREIKRLITLAVDFVFLPLSLWLSFSLRLGELYRPQADIVFLFFVVPVIAIPIFIRFGLYRAIIRYIGFLAMWAVIKAVSLYTLVLGVVILLTALPGVPRSVILINWLVAMLFVGGSRAIARWWLSGSLKPRQNAKRQTRVIIYGAGAAGRQIATALSGGLEFNPVAYMDDNVSLQNNFIQGRRVYSFAQLSELIDDSGATDILLAMPSISRSRRSRIISKLEPYSLRVRILPAMDDLASGKVRVEDVRDVGVRDLLGRNSVEPDTQLLNANVKEKAVLVTGAGGSIGSELCRQIIRIKPKHLVLYEQNEHSLYELEAELNSLVKRLYSDPTGGGIEVVPILASVINQARLEAVCSAYTIDTIYHAAAYKHVPMVEKNPLEAVTNNILGTYRVAKAAIRSRVDTFVLISTDKAVRPTNTMGASKRFAEMILQGLSKHENSKTRFTMVRFGNVLGSSGSVVPLFNKQIKSGGPVTVTDPKIIRYFMTIPEAAQLVIQAGSMGHGGDVFVLDMGEPVKIVDLARRMIRLSGFEIKDNENPDGDIEITYTGLRPGEKLYEELLIGDNVSPTQHELIMTADEESLSLLQVEAFIKLFMLAVENNDVEKSRSLLMEAVVGFSPQCDVADLVYGQERHNTENGVADSKVVKLITK